MSTKHLLILGGGLLAVFFSVWAISAQDAKPAPARPDHPTKIALLDVNYVLKQNEAFQKEMAEIKKDSEEQNKKNKEVESLIAMMTAELQNMTPGSPEYDEQQEKVVRAMTNSKIVSLNKQREFKVREAKTHLLTYLDIGNVLEKYQREHKIGIVLRFTGDPVDSNNPESILAQINNPIVWHDKETDITPQILKCFTDKQTPKEEQSK